MNDNIRVAAPGCELTAERASEIRATALSAYEKLDALGFTRDEIAHLFGWHISMLKAQIEYAREERGRP
jgi:hypothetical protein